MPRPTRASCARTAEIVGRRRNGGLNREASARAIQAISMTYTDADPPLSAGRSLLDVRHRRSLAGGGADP